MPSIQPLWSWGTEIFLIGYLHCSRYVVIMVAYSQRKCCWHLRRNRKHVKLPWNNTWLVCYLTANRIHGVPAGLCHLRAVLAGSEPCPGTAGTEQWGWQANGANPGCFSLPCRENRAEAIRAAQVSAVFLHCIGHDGTEGTLPSGRERSPRGEAVVSSLQQE